ncbi:hypothetical protein NM688_g3212 [Phlebia brevispora]|uniref:Uncharacterized protein n=1 Tax=Phlebia brevispora TaxID=194682 RepID=A0ACC1T6I9_9APHY|nr:hypothetical protein NM688_g3212 [Phlebia brevispora]
MALSEFLVVPASSEHTATVIFLHGLNTTGYAWQEMVSTFASEAPLTHIKWVLPHAPQMPVTAKDGATMHSWYDIFDWDYKLGEDEQGILASSVSLGEIIRDEVESGIPPNRIVLGGFSQGGAMSLLTGLISEWKLAGIVNLSGRLVMRDKLESMMAEDARSRPIFWGHGQQDVLVKYAWAEDAFRFLQHDLTFRAAKNGDIKGIEFHSYKGLAHATSDEELNDLRIWLQRVVPQC